MGVSLERVQFKFASIIGELCSEPVVLSQFAVWLDLRLAEYKSKGAISLDCSGEKPDPSWLKGLRIAVPMSAAGAKRVLGSRITPRATGFSRGGMYSRSSAFHRRNLNSNSKLSQNVQDRSQHDGSDRLSSSENMDNMLGSSSQDNSDDVVVVVKDEPEGSSVYPVSLHQHSSSEAESRKRSAIDSMSGDQDEDISSPYKIPKTANEDSSQNQSLMSVLGTSIDDQSTDVSTVGNESLQNQMDYSVNLQDQKGDSTGYEWGNNSADYSHAVNVSSSSTYSQDQPSTSSATLPSNKTEGFTDSELSSQNVNDGVQSVLQQEGKKPAVWAKLWARVGLRAPSSSLQTMLSKPSPSSHASKAPGASTTSYSPGVASKMSADNLRRRERIKVNSRPRTTVNYMIAAVGTFERWLWAVSENERREIYTIPPEELDPILVDFFTMIKKPCGGQYNPESFISLRSRLDSYLKDNNYPCSITKSDLFCKSQLAFKLRKQELKEAHAESLQ